MDQIDALKFQVDALQKKYTSELSRREAVRSSLAVPIAVLSFAAFGFAALANTADWLDGTLTALTLSVLVLMLSALATICLVTAIFQTGYARPTSGSVGASVFEITGSIEKIQSELVDSGFSIRDARKLAAVSALKTLSEEYEVSTRELIAENRAGLERQQNILRLAVSGFGMLILAIALSTGMKLHEKERISDPDGQIAAGDARLDTSR